MSVSDMGKKKIVEQKGGEELGAREAAGSLKISKKGKKIEAGRVYIRASYNNTLICVTDMAGNVITSASAGSLGFSGPKKATPFASSKIIAAIAERLKSIGMADVEVIMKGVGSGRDSALRSLVNQGFNITAIRDLTPIPHNGPRPPKVRRV